MLLIPSENEIHITVVDYCRANNIPVMHTANERKCSAPYGSLLKRKGVVAGVSDLLIFHPSNKKFGLWLELKRLGGKLTDNQKKWHTHVRSYGYEIGIADSVQLAIRIIDEYIK